MVLPNRDHTDGDSRFTWTDGATTQDDWGTSFFDQPPKSTPGATVPIPERHQAHAIGFQTVLLSLALICALGVGFYILAQTVSQNARGPHFNRQTAAPPGRNRREDAAAIANVIRQFTSAKRRLDAIDLLQNAFQPDILINIVDEIREVDCSACPDDFRIRALEFIISCDSLNSAWIKSRVDVLISGFADFKSGEFRDIPKTAQQAHDTIQTANARIADSWSGVQQAAVKYRVDAN